MLQAERHTDKSHRVLLCRWGQVKRGGGLVVMMDISWTYSGMKRGSWGLMQAVQPAYLS